MPGLTRDSSSDSTSPMTAMMTAIMMALPQLGRRSWGSRTKTLTVQAISRMPTACETTKAARP